MDPLEARVFRRQKSIAFWNGAFWNGASMQDLIIVQMIKPIELGRARDKR
jgi:hypothetical protein